MPRTVLFRLAAILIGVSVTLLAVEATLRIIAWTVAQTHEPVDRGSLVGELRITCVGESTTFGRWPSQLEEILNGAPDGPRVRVINRGDVGILTAGVADRIGGWLDEDKPHLVITMLGINDEGNVLVYGRDESQPWASEHVMVVRLVNLLWRSTFNVGVPEVQREPILEPPEGDAHVAHEICPLFATLGQRRAEAMQSFR